VFQLYIDPFTGGGLLYAANRILQSTSGNHRPRGSWPSFIADSVRSSLSYHISPNDSANFSKENLPHIFRSFIDVPFSHLLQPVCPSLYHYCFPEFRFNIFILLLDKRE
ncbi:MAG: hypothetical protein WA610_10190, partial [Thermodesulfovibrionales bacterium]